MEWLPALFPFFIARVFPGGVRDNELLLPEVRILLKLLDKNGDSLSHVVREVYAPR